MKTTRRIKTKLILTVVVLSVRSVQIQRIVRLIAIALVTFAKTIHVFVSIQSLRILNTTNCFNSAAASCTDGIKNQDETDIDCGGSTCAKCGNSKNCNQASDCISNSCQNNTCVRKYTIFADFKHNELFQFSRCIVHRWYKKSR